MKIKITTGLFAIYIVVALSSCDAAGSIVGNRDELHDKVKEGKTTFYTVSFDGNSATGGAAPAAIPVKAGSGTRLPGEGGLLKTGSIFAGWNTLANGNGDDYGVDELYTPETNTTLFAKWLQDGTILTVTFNKNGGDTEANPETKPVTTPATTVGTLPAEPTRTGWTFTGWNTAADGSGTTFTGSTTITGSRTVYAQWSCTVTFNKNGGDTEANPQTKTVSTPATTVGTLPAEPTRTGWEFTGWNTAANGSGATFTGSTTITDSRTVYAQWSCTVTFNKNGGDTEANPRTKSVSYPATTVGTLPTPPKRSEWIFSGWNTQADGSGTVLNANTVVTGSISVYAQWIALEMAWISPGTFQMDGSDSGGTLRPVTLTKGFYMGIYPVTQEQYEAVMGTNPSSFNTPAAGETDTKRRPVEVVTWYDAVEFCNKLSVAEGLTSTYTITNRYPSYGYPITSADVAVDWDTTGYRLPTEAQWEYACRAGTTTAFNWNSNVITSAQANYDAGHVDAYNTSAGTSLGRTSEVGSYAPNASGLYDMHGNVREWCWDLHADYTNGPQTDPEGPASSGTRVIRGGSWRDNGASLRSANRLKDYLNASNNFIGFRVVRP